jgi:hypothetical protein
LALSRLLQIPGTKYKPPSVLGDTEGSVPLTTDEAIKQLQSKNLLKLFLTLEKKDWLQRLRQKERQQGVRTSQNTHLTYKKD